MKLCIVTVFSCVLVAFSLVNSASIERYESEKPVQTTVIQLLHSSEATNEKRPAEDNRHVVHQQKKEDEYYYDDEEEYEYQLSGDFEVPQVAFSRKPKDPVTAINTERLDSNEKSGKGQKKGRGKGKGKKRNPCLKKYKDFCIHGTCQYLRKIGPSCICHKGYSGERCHVYLLQVWNREEGYNRTTALAVVAVVLSSLCLTIIGLLLALRFHKRGTYEVTNEEKIKLGATTQS